MQGNKRARAAACSTCRIRKRRCLPATDDLYGPCQLCKSTGSPCSLVVQGRATPPTPISQQNIASPPEASHASHAKCESPLPPSKILNDLVNLYFRLIHDGPHTLFHEPSLMADMSTGATPPLLLLSICSLSARFSGDAIFQNVEPRLRGRPYAKAAMELLQQELIKPTLATVQACILLSQYVGGEGDVKAKHIYAGMAMLHSQAIQLWDVRVSAQVDIVTREVCQRTWLSVVITDRWTAADMSRISMSSVKREHNFSLLNEEAFIALQPGAREHNGRLTSSGQGLWAQMAKTIDIFGDISETIFRLGSIRSSTALRDTKISQLATNLDLWVKELPEKLIYSTENLQYFMSFGFGKTFLAMHIGYHHFRQLLSYPFLDACRRSNDEQDLKHVEVCKENAMRVSDIANVAFRTGSCSLLYFIIGHILVVSSSVHLHTLLFSDLQEVDLARDHLVSNFEILMQLKTYWPVIDTAVGRLRTFQNDCRRSMTDPFVLDNWMLKFLIEHSAVLDSERWPSIEQQSEAGEAIHPRPMALTELSGNSGIGSLSALVNDKNLSNDALVENALSWLLG